MAPAPGEDLSRGSNGGQTCTLDNREGDVPMKKLGAFLAITSLLMLVPAAFAAGGDVSTPSLKDQRIVSSEARPDASTLLSPGQYGAGNTRGSLTSNTPAQ